MANKRKARTAEKSGAFIVKVAGACNMNCSYCYMYNLGDTTFRERPRVMRREVAEVALDRVFEYAIQNHLSNIVLNLHGGEPLIAGKTWMKWFLDKALSAKPASLNMDIGLQTNGVLLDEEWLSLLSSYEVGLGVSFDGPAEWHDRHRVNLAGLGTYQHVRRAIELLVENGSKIPPWGVLVVAIPEYSGVAIYKHLIELGVKHMDFLWPDYHHDSPPPWAPGSLTSYYIDIFETWYGTGDASVDVRFFTNAMLLFLGGRTEIDALGPQPISEVVVETDGSLEPLDVLRICENGKTRLGLNVFDNTINDLRSMPLFRTCLNNQNVLPRQCLTCSVFKACGGDTCHIVGVKAELLETAVSTAETCSRFFNTSIDAFKWIFMVVPWSLCSHRDV